jgi:hypothetical protein
MLKTQTTQPKVVNEFHSVERARLVEVTPQECDRIGGGVAPWVLIIRGIHLITTAAGTAAKAAKYGQGKGKDKKPSYPSGGMGSDIRLKSDIRIEGHLPHLDLTVYSWEYTMLPGERFVGVMAQDLLSNPALASAVFTFDQGPFKGYYGVDYARLGLRCMSAQDFTGNVTDLVLDQRVPA